LFEVPVIVVAAAVMLYGTTWCERAIGAFIVGLGTLSVLLTFSRGAYLALFVAAIVLALTHRLRILLLVLVVVVIAAALRLPGVTKRIAQELNLSDPRNSLFPRFQLWGVTMRMLAHHPIFGSGLSGFASAINPYRNGYAELQIYPHNILLNFWTETGLLGLVAFGWLMVKTVIATLGGWLHGSSGWRPYQLGVLLFVVAILASAERITVVGRWVVLAAAVILNHFGNRNSQASVLVVDTVLFGWGLVNLVVSVVLVRGYRPGRWFGFLATGIDLLVATSILYFSGGYGAPTDFSLLF